MSNCPQDLKDLCAEAEATNNTRILPDYAIQFAMDLYGNAVALCEQEGFPLWSIHVEVSSWGERAPLENNPFYDAIATHLSFHNHQWHCERVPHRAGCPFPSGKSYVLLDAKPTKKYDPEKMDDRYRVDLTQFRANLMPFLAPKPSDPKITLKTFPILGVHSQIHTFLLSNYKDIPANPKRKFLAVQNIGTSPLVFADNQAQAKEGGITIAPLQCYVVPPPLRGPFFFTSPENKAFGVAIVSDKIAKK